MARTVTLVPGDGTGAQQADLVRQILTHAGIELDWDVHTPVDGKVTPQMLTSARDSGAVLVGYQHDKAGGERPVIVQLRKELGVWADLRPLKSQRGLQSRFDDVDLLVVRETSEDIYAAMEHESILGVYESFKVTTRAACERIARYAFDEARRRGRGKVTIVHKANIMKQSDGMFLRTAQRIAEDYSDIAVDDCIVDALTMKLVARPSQFDVLLCGNLFGDIIGDLGAGLVGGAINAPSIAKGAGTTVFSASSGARRVASDTNPLVLLHPALYLARHLGFKAEADRVGEAISDVLAAGFVPMSLGGSADGETVVRELCARL